jgi:signal transduction histidine kinase
MARAAKPPSGYTVLVVDDQEETLRSTRRLLEREGHRVLLASSGQEALAIFQRERPQLLVIDYFMPGMTGEELIKRIREGDDGVQILLQTGYAGEKPALAMLDALDIQGYHDKSDGAERLLVWVRVCLKAHRNLQRVREAERLKDELLANMSHELRTPLTISLGYVEMLLDGACGPLGADACEMLRRAERNATALLGLVTDLLELGRLEVQTAETRLDYVELPTLRPVAVDALERFAGGKAVHLRWDVADEAPAIRADPRKLDLVLSQVILSVIGGMSGGEVSVRAHPAGEDRVLLEIRGNRGSRSVEADGNSASGGDGAAVEEITSLGPLMARRVARSMGADLVMHGQSAGGMSYGFTLALPLAVPTTAAELLSPTGAG